MRRDLPRTCAKVHDLVIVGGGVTGACIARDAALRGLSVALIEKQDFSHATSAASSKLIHGGLRYLKKLEVGLIRESLRERRMWLRTAPHLVYPLAMLLPTHRGRSRSEGKPMLRAGLSIYDLLAFDRTWLADPDQRLPGHRSLDIRETLALQPDLPADDLSGAIVYHDCQMFSPERLALECLLSAAAAGAELCNYTLAEGLLRDGSQVLGVRARDLLTNNTHELRARLVINAAGPWADLLLAGLPTSQRVVRSKGVHIITRALTTGHAITFAGKHGHLFLLPWRGHTLIGTTDEAYEGAPDDFRVTEADIASLLASVHEHLPSARLTRADVLHFYGGLRPLVSDGSDDSDASTYDASRRAEVHDHAHADADHAMSGLISAIGGKWTTSRHLAEQVVDLAARKLERRLPACSTATTPLPGGAIANFRRFVADQVQRHPGHDPAMLEHLARNYGTRMGELLHIIDADPNLARPLAEGLPEIGAQVVHALRCEMAVALPDVVFRRTGLGTLGNPGEAALSGAARLMGGPLGWDRAERMRQVERVLDTYGAAP
ncbi:glycerol-3-phosphate dehydrogenase/oxidase [Nannocystis sp.]|uniref:glycerol-3-phosphate dehydrogenase/oxidase n=1 Tax=Nannocystis sp. TaxID=1962667 RepID=UPI0025DEF348|nr:glycerol-3-phosphate dehydrogenase/oxidase [Nannocystis sp.]MBK7824553.1 glycerol-3-phosphate dehydrogenase/oxidase [Nannocystis sp.]